MADAVFLSPPWGGPEYSQQTIFDINAMTPNGNDLFNISRSLTPNVAFLLPRQTSITQLTDLAKKAKSSKERKQEAVEVEETYLNDRLKMMTVYYGDLAHFAEDPEEIKPTEENTNTQTEILHPDTLINSNTKKRRRSRKKEQNKKQKIEM